MISAVLERKAWVFTRGKNFYANQFVFLVGPPGSGKGNIIAHAKMILGTMDLFLASTSVSRASIIDELNEASRKLINPGKIPEFTEYNFLNVIMTELGAFLSAYESDFINALTDIYDGVPYGDRKRAGKINIKMATPQINMLAGTTPAALQKILPEGAWDEGFMSRVICIYSGERLKTDPFTDEFEGEESIKLLKDIVEDLKLISKIYGRIYFDPEVEELVRNWIKMDLMPAPEHPKLVHYLERRLGHFFKLCIIASVSRASDMRIIVEDYQDAMNWLLEAEAMMPDIFANMGIGGDSKAMEDTWYYIYTTYKKTGKPVFDNAVCAFLSERVASHNIHRVIEIMVRSGMLRVEPVRGLQAYVPADKRKL